MNGLVCGHNIKIWPLGGVVLRVLYKPGILWQCSVLCELMMSLSLLHTVRTVMLPGGYIQVLIIKAHWMASSRHTSRGPERPYEHTKWTSTVVRLRGQHHPCQEQLYMQREAHTFVAKFVATVPPFPACFWTPLLDVPVGYAKLEKCSVNWVA